MLLLPRQKNYRTFFSSSQFESEKPETKLIVLEGALELNDDIHSDWKRYVPFYFAVKKYILGSYPLPPSFKR